MVTGDTTAEDRGKSDHHAPETPSQATALDNWSDDPHRLLIVDQFEELFTTWDCSSTLRCHISPEVRLGVGPAAAG